MYGRCALSFRHAAFLVALSERQQIDYVKDYLWRQYGPDKLEELKTFANSVFTSATNEITITNTSAEGASVGGVPKFNKLTVGVACEELIKGMDPAWTPPPSVPPVREMSATVWLR